MVVVVTGSVAAMTTGVSVTKATGGVAATMAAGIWHMAGLLTGKAGKAVESRS